MKRVITIAAIAIIGLIIWNMVPDYRCQICGNYGYGNPYTTYVNGQWYYTCGNCHDIYNQMED